MLVVAEVVTNAVEHGTGTSIAINLDVDPTIATIAVIQDGEVDLGDPSTWTMPPPESESGRGLALVRGLVDHAEWSVSDGQLTVRVDRRHSIG